LTEEGKGERVSENILTLIIEVTGEKKKGKEAKVAQQGTSGYWLLIMVMSCRVMYPQIISNLFVAI